MNLSAVFTKVAHKQLVAVDLPNTGSNQHELNGVAVLKEFFGIAEATRGNLAWHYFADDQDPAAEQGEFTFYDSRAEHPTRSEWRFYYKGDFLSRANIGDWFFLARSVTGRLCGLVFQRDSAWLRAAQELFGVHTANRSFDALRQDALNGRRLELIRRQILEELGFEIVVPVCATDEELMLEKYSRTFPKTKEMSAFARSQSEVDLNNPDEALIGWLDREEQLFRALENVIIREQLQRGFVNVDDFIAYSLSVQNRRKSRMGFALQNHLEELFRQSRLRFTPQAHTETTNRPDFILPGEVEYHNNAFDASLLVMLGVKSTSKDRWRQVLTEADRIHGKHLCTLEASISSKQTDEMARQRLTLVVPEPLHRTYTDTQLAGMMSLGEFIEFVRQKQNA